MRKALIALCLVLAVCAIAAAGGKSESSSSGGGQGAAALQKVEFLLNYTISADHSPYYIAMEKGWYREEGLDVNIIVGKGSGYSVQMVDTGKADLAIADAANPIVMRDDGAMIKIIGVVFDKIGNCAWFWNDSGIKTPQDLIGKTAALPATDGHKVMWPAFCKLVGIPVDSVKWINIDAAAKVPSLASRNCDVTFELFYTLPFYERALGKDKVGYFLWNDYGYDVYAHSYIASDDTIKNNPELLRKMLKVNYRAWQYALEHQDEAIETLAKYHPINIDEYKASFTYMTELFKTDRYKNQGIGYIDPVRMKLTYDTVNEYQKQLSFPAEDAYDTSLLPNPMYKYNF
jgi:NitT/TauT family transport system substrate-binding protein